MKLPLYLDSRHWASPLNFRSHLLNKGLSFERSLSFKLSSAAFLEEALNYFAVIACLGLLIQTFKLDFRRHCRRQSQYIQTSLGCPT